MTTGLFFYRFLKVLFPLIRKKCDFMHEIALRFDIFWDHLKSFGTKKRKLPHCPLKAIWQHSFFLFVVVYHGTILASEHGNFIIW